MCMVDDADPWEFVTESRPVARKPHRCGECRRTIEPGEHYARTEGRADGAWLTYVVCAHCDVLGSWLVGLCAGYLFENIAEDVREHLVDGIGGLDVARALAGHRMRWRSRRTGELLPIPDTLVVPERPRWAA